MKETNNLITPSANWLDDATSFHEGKALVRKGDVLFFINKDGEDIFPSLRFENAGSFSDGCAWVKLNGKVGILNHSGVIKNSKKTIEEFISFSEGRAFVRYENDKRWLCTDKEFNELFILEGYDPVDMYVEGFAIVRREKIELEPEPLSEEELEKIKEFEPDLENFCYTDEEFGITEQDKHHEITQEELRFEYEDSESDEPVYEYNFIDKDGKLLSEEWYDFAESFSEGFAVVGYHLYSDVYYYNYIDSQGKKLCEQNFAEVFAFSEGLGAVALENDDDGPCFSHCYVDRSGQLVMPRELNIPSGSIAEKIYPRYNKAFPFKEGIACIGWQYEDSMDGHLIDHDGNILYSFIYDSEYMLFGYKEGYAGFAVVEGFELKEQYFVDQQGNKVFDKSFDEILPFSEGLALVKVGGKYNYIDRNGEYLIK